MGIIWTYGGPKVSNCALSVPHSGLNILWEGSHNQNSDAGGTGVCQYCIFLVKPDSGLKSLTWGVRGVYAHAFIGLSCE